jgi:glycosyltransferase involved in cell wall biosynthesis
MRISFITTVYNEEKSIDAFLNSLFAQTKLPDEVIIVDGDSTDATASVISNLKSQSSNKRRKIKFTLVIKRGNRSVGRNEAIRKATGDIIVCSDSGNILDKKWVENIVEPFLHSSQSSLRRRGVFNGVDVVAGYYKGKAENVFQKCLVPYVLVMPDKVDPDNFLPATRSIAFTKAIWKKVGGFDEKYSHNEDYVFARKLKDAGAKIVFAKDAIVYWIPRTALKEACIMFFRFAFGDAESGILRDKVVFVYARYILWLYLLILFFLIKSLLILAFIIVCLVLYILWAVKKNYKYVMDPKAYFILPGLQLLSDSAVLVGTTLGLLKLLAKINYLRILGKNYLLVVLLTIYVVTMLAVITSGVPNQSHPFTYQMDEWHQSQSVRSVFKHGSPNLPGAANGTMFNFFITGILLIPFYLLKIIDPFAIKSSVDLLLEQEKLFIVLRLTTLFWGVLTAIVLAKIAKMLHLNRFLISLLFIFTPAWLVLSNFFKYDIALTFWIVLALLYLIKYSFSKDMKHFLFACFFSGVAFAVKVSAIPLLPIIFLSYFLFTPIFHKRYLYLFGGVLLFLFNVIFLGLPDIVFGGRDMYEYLYENIVLSSQIVENYNLGDTLLNLTLFHKLPAIFGHVLYGFSFIALLYVIVLILKDYKNKNYVDFKIKLFILLSFFIFCLSFIPLGVTISANRSVVLLPFMVILIGMAFKNLSSILIKNNTVKVIGILFFIILVSIQIVESYIWIQMKLIPAPQQVSSSWVEQNIRKNATIGLENIPIYQFEPDFILKEFYDKQYHPGIKTKYTYSVIDVKTKKLPKYVILSNVDFEKRFYKKSFKNDLVKRLEKEKYKRIQYFALTQPLYDYFNKYFYYPYLGLFTYPDGISIYKK